MIPIRVKQFPNFLRDLMARRRILNQPEVKGRRFHLCYFSCESYFRYLYCSIHSLVKQLEDYEYKIYVFSDTDMPIATNQISLLMALPLEVEVIPWPKSMGWGTEQIENIWNAYRYVEQQASSEDIIARIDSDVFFFNRRVFEVVSRTDADMIGDGHFVDFSFTQGGCYFFKVTAVRAILDLIERRGMKNLVDNLEPIVEDVAAYTFSQILGFKILMTWFMVFPQEIKNSGGIGRWINFKFSCAHFVMKNKNVMLKIYREDFLEADERRKFDSEFERMV